MNFLSLFSGLKLSLDQLLSVFAERLRSLLFSSCVNACTIDPLYYEAALAASRKLSPALPSKEGLDFLLE